MNRLTQCRPNAFIFLTACALTLPLATSAGEQSFADAEVKLMDADKDGAVSTREHSAGARKMFERMDANKDGEVTAAEMEASHGSMPSAGERGQKMSAQAKIRAVDKDADGKLTAEEHAADSRDMFSKMDGDRDGKLSKNEIQIAHDMMMTTDQ
ncbi:MAG: EF-hand domain-containing protein [Steroidobacter sp.]